MPRTVVRSRAVGEPKGRVRGLKSVGVMSDGGGVVFGCEGLGTQISLSRHGRCRVQLGYATKYCVVNIKRQSRGSVS